MGRNNENANRSVSPHLTPIMGSTPFAVSALATNYKIIPQCCKCISEMTYPIYRETKLIIYKLILIYSLNCPIFTLHFKLYQRFRFWKN